MEIKYQEISIQSIVEDFARNFEFEKGRSLSNYEWFYDPVEGIVIFKLLINEDFDETNLNQGRPTGYKHTPESIEKIGQASRDRNAVPYLKNGKHWLKTASPEDNPKWKGGITPERQAFYHSKEWKEAVKAVWKRDNAICQRCKLDHRTLDRKTARKFHIHHIVSFEVKELRAKIDNLVLLCHSCHMWVHSKKNTKGEFINEQ